MMAGLLMSNPQYQLHEKVFLQLDWHGCQNTYCPCLVGSLVLFAFSVFTDHLLLIVTLSVCKFCPMGTFSATPRSVACSPCPPRTYAAVLPNAGGLGAVQCLQCPSAALMASGEAGDANNWSPPCIRCSARMVASELGDSCVCAAGYYFPPPYGDSMNSGTSCIFHELFCQWEWVLISSQSKQQLYINRMILYFPVGPSQ